MNAKSERRIAEIMESAYKCINNRPNKNKPKVKSVTAKANKDNANNKGYKHKRPVVVIRGDERFDFPSIAACAQSKFFRCSPNQIRKHAEGLPSGNLKVYYKDKLPEVLK